jgi:hypothetical protein
LNAKIPIGWREANRLHDQLDAMRVVLDDNRMSPWDKHDALGAQIHNLRETLPHRFTPSSLNPEPGVRLCAVCRKHREGGHERDSSNWCDADEETDASHQERRDDQ